MSKTYSYKKFPTFNPDYYRSWASDIESAFADYNKTVEITNDIIDDEINTKEQQKPNE